MEAVLRARTLSETRGFLKALVEADGDRILGFTAFAVGAGEIMTSVQVAMIAEMPYTALRDAILTHPTLWKGLSHYSRPHLRHQNLSILKRTGVDHGNSGNQFPPSAPRPIVDKRTGNWEQLAIRGIANSHNILTWS